MWTWLEHVFGGGFMPHGHCYLWQPSMVLLQVLSNASIGLAYIAISVTIYYIVRKIEDVPFSWMFLAFGAFIITCGGTHLSDVAMIWYPLYWIDGGLRAVTAVASVGTAVLLVPLVPKAIALAGSARLAQERGLRLERAHRELTEAHVRAVEVERTKSQFFANVSHELRTPLTLILGPVAKVLADESLSVDARNKLDVVARNARLLLKHVNDLLDVARLEAGRMQADYERADLARIVRGTAAHFEALARERGARFTVDAQGTLLAEIDPHKVERIALNLLSNAFKFTQASEAVRCSLRSEGEWAILEVADGGPGVPLDMRRVIFERFAQVHDSNTRKLGGTGLGLAIVRDFVLLHRGSIVVGDAPEGGAIFTVRIPLRAPDGTAVQAAPDVEPPNAEEASRAVEELRARPRDAPAAAVDARAPLVLVVEDNLEMNRFLCDTLRSHYRVESAADGREGIEKAIALEPELVLSDVMMPRASGEDLVTELRRRPELEAMPIVLLTARADEELRVRLLRSGAQDYVMKPFSAEELMARVTNLVTMKRVRDALQSELAGREIDLAQLADEVARSKRKLEEMLEAMRVARDQAERASQLKTEFLGLVSHELRTPLSTLALALQRLGSDKGPPLDGRQRDILDRMSRATKRLTDLVESLLEYARIHGGKVKIELVDVDLRAVVAEAVEEVRPQAEQKGLAIRLVASETGEGLRSDPRLVRLVVGNLLANAVKFTESGSVEVDVSSDDKTAWVRVTDTGPGIGPLDQARIFEPFAQGEPPRQKHLPGVGLGLAIAHDLVQALGGRLTVDSKPGRGSAFTIELVRER